MPKFEGPYRVLEIKDNNLIIWKGGRRVTVNIDQVRVYRPRQTDTISSDSPVETLYDEQEVSRGSNMSNQRQFKEHRKTSSQERVESIAGPSRLPDRRRTATSTGGSRMEGSGRDNQTRQTRATMRGCNKQAEKPVRSNQATTRRPCPYYLRSRIRESDGIPEELRNIEINGIPHSKIRRRSLSMEALDGDPAHLVPTFGAPASSVPEGGQYYGPALSGKVTGVSKVRFHILVPHQEPLEHFPHCKNFKNTTKKNFLRPYICKLDSDTTVLANYGRPALFDKVTGTSKIPFQILIPRSETHTEPIFDAPVSVN
ncbi:uncharacterized protein TNCV_157671 [Trichonephila clavipes]|nr:uncharacterized protein TNCV_157671 [Trichonephila clavipes]